MSLISVKDARKILGKEAEQMTDEQIENLVVDLGVIARWSLKHATSELNNQKQAETEKHSS